MMSIKKDIKAQKKYFQVNYLSTCQLLVPSAMFPLRSPKESPEVSWLLKEVETLVGDIEVLTDMLLGDKEVFGSEEPELEVSDMELPPKESEEPSDAKSEVGDTERGVKPNSLKRLFDKNL